MSKTSNWANVLDCWTNRGQSEFVPQGSKYLLRKCLGYNLLQFGGLGTFSDSVWIHRGTLFFRRCTCLVVLGTYIIESCVVNLDDMSFETATSVRPAQADVKNWKEEAQAPRDSSVWLKQRQNPPRMGMATIPPLETVVISGLVYYCFIHIRYRYTYINIYIYSYTCIHIDSCVTCSRPIHRKRSSMTTALDDGPSYECNLLFFRISCFQTYEIILEL